ncbi:unnamed protein product, partial [Prorocentrum cordatum]
MPRAAFEVSLGPPEWERPGPRGAGGGGGAEEEAPLLRKLGDTAEWLAHSDDTDPARLVAGWFRDFGPSVGLRSPHAAAWLALQV